MAVVSIRPYVTTPKDTADKFHGAQLLYIGWDKHLMFYSAITLCLPPTTNFGELTTNQLKAAYGIHPDFERIDWSQVQWTKSGKPWTPDYSKTLAENGLTHKDVLRFQTPGLDGLYGCNF